MAKKALLVGINRYPDPVNNLNSCVADTNVFRDEILIKQCGFDPADITMLHNSDATLKKVTEGLEGLVAGAAPGDQLVFFESSHGYRQPKGNTLVEVLCLYDDFLEDTELVRLTGKLPPGVLTVVVDACHAGGMNKLFVTAEGTSAPRAKVFTPTTDEALTDVDLMDQVTEVKFFGHASTSEPAAIVERFAAPSVDVVELPHSKSFGAGAVELGGALVAACKADQTAAAGSPTTNGLSAFTYGLAQEMDTSASLATLVDRVGARLSGLALSQTPVVETPMDHPEYSEQTFVAFGPTGGAPRRWDYGDAVWNATFGRRAG